MSRKVRFYMRGIGIGMLVTALILTIAHLAGGGREMTDAEIRARAAELGMVDRTNYSLVDAENDRNGESGSGVQEPGDSGAQASEQAGAESSNQPSEEPTGASETEEVPGGEATESSSETRNENTENDAAVTNEEPERTDVTNVSEPAEPVEPAEPEMPESAAANGSVDESVETVSITITSGSGSDRVARQLQEVGAVTDAADFDRYLETSGYSRSIGTGLFVIPVGSDYETIAKIITRRLP